MLIEEKIDGVVKSSYNVESIDEVNVNEGIEYFVDGVSNATLNGNAKDFSQQLSKLDKAIVLTQLDLANNTRAGGTSQITASQFIQQVKDKYDAI